MDVREKLVELIGSTEYGNGSLVGKNFQKGFIEKIASNLIAHGVTVQEWISTDERMPTEADATDGYVAVVYARGNGVKTKTISLVDVIIAHPDLYDYWMPLNSPQPPEGE